MKKSALKLIACALISVFILVGCSSGENQSAETTVSNEPKTSAIVRDITYKLAVEVDGYDGNIFESGTYIFDVSNKKLGKAPMYNVFIENKPCRPEEYGEIDFVVGGAGSFAIKHTLNKGDYVYIVPYGGLAYEPEGYMILTKE